MVGIKDIQVGKSYKFTPSIFLFVHRKVSDQEYKTISVEVNKSIDYDSQLWFSQDSYYRNDKRFTEIDVDEFIKVLNQTTEEITRKTIKTTLKKDVKKEVKKLDFKYLAPYLLHDLKVVMNNGETGDIVGWRKLSSTVYVYKDVFEDYTVNTEDVKPILRPISSMTSDENKELQELADNDDIYMAVSKSDIWLENNILDPTDGHLELYISDLYKVYDWLFRNHFDVFGLIDRKLAIEKQNK